MGRRYGEGVEVNVETRWSDGIGWEEESVLTGEVFIPYSPNHHLIMVQTAR